MRVIGLSGYPGCGKDTAALALTQRGWERLAFGDKLKLGALAIDPIVGAVVPHGSHTVKLIRMSEAVKAYGMEEAKRRFTEIRRFYQRYGTEGGRDIHGQDCWLRVVRDQIDEFTEMTPEDRPAGVVITDVRFHEEYDLVKSYGGSVFYVERESLSYSPSHASEQYRFPFDGRLANDASVDDLHGGLLDLVNAAALA